MLYVQSTLNADPEVFLDPNTLSEDGTVALSVNAFSEDGDLFAFGLSESGSDWNSIQVTMVTGEGRGEGEFIIVVFIVKILHTLTAAETVAMKEILELKSLLLTM